MSKCDAFNGKGEKCDSPSAGHYATHGEHNHHVCWSHRNATSFHKGCPKPVQQELAGMPVTNTEKGREAIKTSREAIEKVEENNSITLEVMRIYQEVGNTVFYFTAKVWTGSSLEEWKALCRTLLAHPQYEGIKGFMALEVGGDGRRLLVMDREGPRILLAQDTRLRRVRTTNRTYGNNTARTVK